MSADDDMRDKHGLEPRPRHCRSCGGPCQFAHPPADVHRHDDGSECPQPRATLVEENRRLYEEEAATPLFQRQYGPPGVRGDVAAEVLRWAASEFDPNSYSQFSEADARRQLLELAKILEARRG